MLFRHYPKYRCPLIGTLLIYINLQLKKFQKKRQTETPSPSLVDSSDISSKEELQRMSTEDKGDDARHIQETSTGIWVLLYNDHRFSDQI